MNRERAVDLAEHLLRNLDDGQETWPLSLVTAVYVFGSFARGALTPGTLTLTSRRTAISSGPRTSCGRSRLAATLSSHCGRR